MSHDTVKIIGTLKDKARDLLGGAHPTPARIESLLTELEQARAIMAIGADPERPAPASEPVSEPEPRADLADTKAQLVEAFEDLELEDTVADPVAREALPAPQDPRDAVLHALMAQVAELTKEVKALRKPATAEEIAEARGEGRLPPVIAAPPLGFTSGGPGAWPLGQWFTSPLGPRVWMKICEECGRGTQHHWYCCICKAGPFHYATPCKQHNDPMRHPFYTKNHFGPGQVWGVGHACCSKPCMDDYLARMGVVAGVNDAEPVRAMPEPGQPQGEPQRPVTALTSD